MEIIKKQKAKIINRRWLYGIAAFLLGVAPLAAGVMPFGCAFLCALPQKGRRYAFFGLLLASLFDSCIPLSLFCAVYLYWVFTALEKNGSVFMHTRVLLSLSVSALRGAYIAVSGIEDMSGVFSLLAAVVAYPAFTYAYRGYFDKKRAMRPKRYDIALLAFAFSFTVLCHSFVIFNASLGIFAGALFTLYAAAKKGFTYGGACGLICGLACGGEVMGALGVMGMAYGLLAADAEIIALLLSFMLSVSGYFYLAGGSGVGPLMVMLALAYGVFIPLRKNIEVCRYTVSSAEKRANDRRISRYAAAFSSLSSLFYNVSDTTKQESVTDINKKIVSAVDDYCNRCQGCELDKCEISNFFTLELRREGVIAPSKMPMHITSRCPHASAMARSVNRITALREKEGEDSLKRMAEEYSAFSTLLVDAAKKQENSSRSDKAMAEKVKKALSEIGITCDGVRVTGDRIREITAFGVTPDKIKNTPREISNAVRSVVGTAVSPPEMLFHDGYVLMKLNSTPAFRVECAKLSEAKNGESVCGDTVSVFENDERYFYCLVSDGMGSGRDAALTSKLSAIMLEKLLTVGVEKESALKLLNKALIEKEEEVFATVDLLEIDRVLSTATLIKAGAAPTVLIRNGKSVLLQAKTPPAGIMRNVIADKKTFALEKGDMIVMLSDGILQTDSQRDFLADGVSQIKSARGLAAKVLKDAVENCESSDDMSVCVLRIC